MALGLKFTPKKSLAITIFSLLFPVRKTFSSVKKIGTQYEASFLTVTYKCVSKKHEICSYANILPKLNVLQKNTIRIRNEAIKQLYTDDIIKSVENKKT